MVYGIAPYPNQAAFLHSVPTTSTQPSGSITNHQAYDINPANPVRTASLTPYLSSRTATTSRAVHTYRAASAGVDRDDREASNIAHPTPYYQTLWNPPMMQLLGLSENVYFNLSVPGEIPSDAHFPNPAISSSTNLPPTQNVIPSTGPLLTRDRAGHIPTNSGHSLTLTAPAPATLASQLQPERASRSFPPLPGHIPNPPGTVDNQCSARKVTDVD